MIPHFAIIGQFIGHFYDDFVDQFINSMWFNDNLVIVDIQWMVH